MVRDTNGKGSLFWWSVDNEKQRGRQISRRTKTEFLWHTNKTPEHGLQACVDKDCKDPEVRSTAVDHTPDWLGVRKWREIERRREKKLLGEMGSLGHRTPPPTPPFSEIWCFCLGGLVLSQVAIA